MSDKQHTNATTTAPQQKLSEQERADAQRRAQAALEARRKPGGTKTSSASPLIEPFLRPANEDDDGYDPYSDRIEVPSLYEEDPWR
ncbi:MAG: hypothetical protein RR547_07245 [Raoultibacter sp.]